MWRAVEFPYKELPGFSKKLLADHFKLYHGYVDRLNKLASGIQKFSPKGDKSEFQRLKVDEGFLRNAIALHELYFEQLTSGGSGSAADVFTCVTDELMEHLALTAMGSTGWAILAADLYEDQTFVFTMKEHSQGFVAGAWPLVVVDCYEHAYMREYGTDKEAYLEAFFKNVDWEVVKRRMMDSSVMREVCAGQAATR